MTVPDMLIAKGEKELFVLPRMANRHGMIAGATGTGKTVSLQVLAENLSRIGVPTFMADVKGDLSGISQPGAETPRIRERIELPEARGFRLLRESGDLLGRLRRAGPSRPDDGFGHGAAPASPGSSTSTRSSPGS